MVVNACRHPFETEPWASAQASVTPVQKPELGVVEPTQAQTSLSVKGAKAQTTRAELEARPNASLVRTSAAEPLNAATDCKAGLSSVRIGEGKRDSGREAAIGRIPVISANGTPLMPCLASKARKLLEQGKARKYWNKLGVFCVRLNFDPKAPARQPLAVGIDPGSKFEGFSVVGKHDTVLNIMSEAVDWVKKAIETRREMRHARRSRNTRCRERRPGNRLARRTWLPPSTKARWDAKLRIVQQLQKVLPLTDAVVEDVKAETRKGLKKWNTNFSPVETGKQYLYRGLKQLGLRLTLKRGRETKELRDKRGLMKLGGSKSRPVFESHCVDSWALASSVTGATEPTTRDLYYLVPLQWHRRQLHYLKPSKGGVRPRYGCTISFGLKRGTLVRRLKLSTLARLLKRRLCYVGGWKSGRLSLHSPVTGNRVTRRARREELKPLTRIAFRCQFHSSLRVERNCTKSGGFDT